MGVAVLGVAAVVGGCGSGGSSSPLNDAVKQTQATQATCAKEMTTSDYRQCISERSGPALDDTAKYRATPSSLGACSDAGAALASTIEEWYQYTTGNPAQPTTLNDLTTTDAAYRKACA